MEEISLAEAVVDAEVTNSTPREEPQAEKVTPNNDPATFPAQNNLLNSHSPPPQAQPPPQSVQDSPTARATVQPPTISLTNGSAEGHRSVSSTKSDALHSEGNSTSDDRLGPSSSSPPGQTAPEPRKLDAEIARLKELLQQTSPEAAQQVFREQWRVFFFTPYNEDHISFLLRAGLKNSKSRVIERVLKEDAAFKTAVLSVASKKQGISELVLRTATSSQLVDNVPGRVLDRALADRLKNAPAKEIVRWLAEAGRLGYSEDDILDEDDESVIPNLPSVPLSQDEDAVMSDGPPANLNIALPYMDYLLAEQERNAEIQRQKQLLKTQHREAAPVRTKIGHGLPGGNVGSDPLACPICSHKFTTLSGYNYHVNKRVCEKKEPLDGSKWTCMNCNQRFTTKQGLAYHVMHKVCEGDNIAPPTSPSKELQQEAAANHSIRPLTTTRDPSDHILPPLRPTFAGAPRATAAPVAPPAQAEQLREQLESQSRASVVSIPRPPLHTPTATSAPLATQPTQNQRAHYSSPLGQAKVADPDIRQSPSELPAAKLEALNKQLQDADDKYEQHIAAIPKNATSEERARKLISLKNGNASRKSQIRRSFGVTLRMREKDKVAKTVAAVTPTATIPRLASYRVPLHSDAQPRSSPVVPFPQVPSQPTSGFSPINTVRANSGPTNGYSLPPTQILARPNSTSPLNASQDYRSGFGILRPENASQVQSRDMTPATYVHIRHLNTHDQHPNKRQRVSEDDEPNTPRIIQNEHKSNAGSLQQNGNPNSHSLPPMHGRAEAEISKAKRVPVAGAQAMWEQFQSKQRSNPEEHRDSESGNSAPIEVVPTAHDKTVVTIAGTKEAVIIIDSSDEEEFEVKANASNDAALRKSISMATDKLPPPPGDTHFETDKGMGLTERGPSAINRVRGAFMAKRGGRRKQFT